MAIHGGKASSESKVELIGFNLPPGASVQTRAGDSEEMKIAVDPAIYRARRPLEVAVTGDPVVLEAEPNDNASQATFLIIPGTACGRIGRAAGSDGTTADIDLFRFEAKAGDTWIFETEAARRGSPVDTRIEVLDASGASVERVLLQATLDSRVFFRSINSQQIDARMASWEDMEMNQYL